MDSANKEFKSKSDRLGFILLIAGVLLASLSAVAWYLHLNYGEPMIVVALLTYLSSLFILILWLTRLTNERLILAGFVFLVVSALVFALTQIIKVNYIELFSFSRELLRGQSIEEYDPRYVMNWWHFFLLPFLLMLNLGTAALTLLAFATLGKRKMLNRRREKAG